MKPQESTRICDNCQNTIAEKRCVLCNADMCVECSCNVYMNISSLRNPDNYVSILSNNQKINIYFKEIIVCPNCEQFLGQYNDEISKLFKDDETFNKLFDEFTYKLIKLRAVSDVKKKGKTKVVPSEAMALAQMNYQINKQISGLHSGRKRWWPFRK